MLMITDASCQKPGDLESSDLKIIKIYIIRNRKYHSFSLRLRFCFNILFSAETLLLCAVGVSIAVTEIRYPVAAAWDKCAPRCESAGKKLQWSRSALSCCVISCQLHITRRVCVRPSCTQARRLHPGEGNGAGLKVDFVLTF